ncbi:hypothetical protein ACJDU8_22955 [Clostridium sp. WILCCON 0269]|uniref:UVR domain-containing protein n=1 Tax=Candidatus Clostridium eludens TaxID=3381663 RepID=A0ABW8SRH3_9CLOT
MILTEFYRQKIGQIDNEIREAENTRDFKRLAKLQAERLEVERKMKEIQQGCYQVK